MLLQSDFTISASSVLVVRVRADFCAHVCAKGRWFGNGVRASVDVRRHWLAAVARSYVSIALRAALSRCRRLL